MAKNSTILLGKYSAANKVIRTDLKYIECVQTKKEMIIKELKKGEKSGFIENFNRNSFLYKMHQIRFEDSK